MENKFNLFLESVNIDNQNFVKELNDYLLSQKCQCEIKSAKSGYVVSYLLPDTKKTLANFVFRKSGIKLRIYADHVSSYQTFLNQLPEKMKKEIRKASVCKRLINPDDCNPKCAMGYTFSLDEETYQKCRFMAFMPTLNNENNPYIFQFIKNELSSKKEV